MNNFYKHPETGALVSKEEYFAIMFGEEFMASNDKGSLKQYAE